MAAMSSGRPTRRTGVSDAWWLTVLPSRPLSAERRNIGVSMNPGGIVFTVMPLGPNSSANDLVRPIMPAFDADRRAAVGGDLGRRVVGGVAVAVEHRHLEPVLRQPLGDGETDARRAPGDDGGAPTSGVAGRRIGARRIGAHWIGSSPAKVVRCMSRGDVGS